MRVLLKKFPYRYMEYEKQLLIREINTVLPGSSIISDTREIEVEVPQEEFGSIRNLTFIMEYKQITEDEWLPTIQYVLERDDTLKVKKQHTRYSTHGIHEYKGKYNPQVVHCLMNLFHINTDSLVLDPFNGSGTTILECAHLGVNAIGTDINPMACFISNTKIKALSINVKEAREIIDCLVCNIRTMKDFEVSGADERITYLKRWIPEPTLAILEKIKSFTDNLSEGLAKLILIVASDLIRDYSNQEPSDLRIRKRTSPFPDMDFISVFEENIGKYLRKIEEIQINFGIINTTNKAINIDIKNATGISDTKFDAAITSPPYVTALPYIDTQRISLVWLGLCEAANIMELEGSLIGSRELIKDAKVKWKEAAATNGCSIPENIYSLVVDMENSIGPKDGFRKKAMPVLLYRYLAEMKDMFESVSNMMKPNAPYALIVGHNKTTLGGKEFFIDTPELLAQLAISVGWKLEEITQLETYKRYGIHSKNAINKESLIILRNKM